MVRRPFHAEEIDLRPEPEDEVVVGQRLELLERHLAGIQVDGRDQVLVDPRVVLVVEKVADRVADGRLLEQARRHLVQQRLERVVVVLVHDDDLDVALLQLLRSADSGKASAEDEDGVAVAVVESGHEAKVRRPHGSRSSRRDDWPQAIVRPSDFRPWVFDRVRDLGSRERSGHGNNFARARASWFIPTGRCGEPQVDPRLMSEATPAPQSRRARPASRNRRAPARASARPAAAILVAAVANLNLAVANVALPDIGKAFDASQTTLEPGRRRLLARAGRLGALPRRARRPLRPQADAHPRHGALGPGLPARRLGARRSRCSFVARLLGGLAAGMAYPTTLALITALWSGPGRTKSIALWSAHRRRDRRARPAALRRRCSSTSGGARSS